MCLNTGLVCRDVAFPHITCELAPLYNGDNGDNGDNGAHIARTRRATPFKQAQVRYAPRPHRDSMLWFLSSLLASSATKCDTLAEQQQLYEAYTLAFDEACKGREPPCGKREMGADVHQFLEDVYTVQLAAVRTSSKRPLRTVCQTGLNTGTSALAFLCGTSNETTVRSWDLGQHEYVRVSDQLLNRFFPGRHVSTLGDSQITLPAEVSKDLSSRVSCDFVYVDGGHTLQIAQSDLACFRNLSTTGTPVAVDNCNAFGLDHYRGGVPAVNKAYELALAKGWITHWRQVSINSCKAIGEVYSSKSRAIGLHCRETCIGSYVNERPRCGKRFGPDGKLRDWCSEP